MGRQAGDDGKLLERITVVPGIFGGKPVIRGRRLAVEHVLGMLAAGDDVETILDGYPWLEAEDVQACLIYSRSVDDGVEPGVRMENRRRAELRVGRGREPGDERGE